MLRAVHDHARQHGRERRAAVDPARPARVDLRRSSGRSTPTRCRSPSCSSPAAGSATSSAAGACSSFGVVVFAASSALIGFAPTETLARRRPRAPGRRRRVHDAGDPLDHLEHVPGRRSAARRSARGPASRRWRSRSARSSAARSTEYVSWRSIFFLNLPVAIGAVVVTLFAAHESRDETVEPHASTSPASPRSPSASPRSSSRSSRATSGAGARPRSSALLATARRRPRRLRRSSSAHAARRWSTSRSSARARSSGANIVAFIVSFAMLAMFFFLALYMQNILRLQPAGGRRALPALDARDHLRRRRSPAGSPTASARAPLIDRRPAARRALAVLAVAARRRHGLRLPARAVHDHGPRHGPDDVADEHRRHERRRPDKAGVASGILSMSRMVGGTFGVAAIGALITALGRSSSPSCSRRSRTARASAWRGLGTGGAAGASPTWSTPRARRSCTRFRRAAARAGVGARRRRGRPGARSRARPRRARAPRRRGRRRHAGGDGGRGERSARSGRGRPPRRRARRCGSSTASDADEIAQLRGRASSSGSTSIDPSNDDRRRSAALGPAPARLERQLELKASGPSSTTTTNALMGFSASTGTAREAARGGPPPASAATEWSPSDRACTALAHAARGTRERERRRRAVRRLPHPRRAHRSFFPVLERIDDEIDALEDAVLERPTDERCSASRS